MTIYNTTVRVRCRFVEETEWAHRVTIGARTGWLGKGFTTLKAIAPAPGEFWAIMPQWLALDCAFAYEKLEPQTDQPREPARL